MPYALRRARRKGKPVGNFFIRTPGGQVNLETTDKTKAKRRAELYDLGKWPVTAKEAAKVVEKVSKPVAPEPRVQSSSVVDVPPAAEEPQATQANPDIVVGELLEDAAAVGGSAAVGGDLSGGGDGGGGDADGGTSGGWWEWFGLESEEQAVDFGAQALVSVSYMATEAVATWRKRQLGPVAEPIVKIQMQSARLIVRTELPKLLAGSEPPDPITVFAVAWLAGSAMQFMGSKPIEKKAKQAQQTPEGEGA